jgi:transketolase
LDIKKLKEQYPEHWIKSCAVRMLSIDAVQRANSGHPGMPMGMADVVTVLFDKHLKFDSSKPDWPDRDRFVLSAGHGSILLYSLMYLSGYSDIGVADIKKFRKLHSKTAGHPEYGHAAGIETTTGPLGQGLANGVGFALAEEFMRALWGKKTVDHRTFVLVGDGCLMEGISQEAIAFAGKQKLGKLIVLWDDNGITIDGHISKSCITDQILRFKASNWSVFECDGHNPSSIDTALTAAKKCELPSLIKCTTHIGYGSPNKQDSAGAHGSPLGEEEIKHIRKVYNWNYEPFEIPEEIKSKWLSVGDRGQGTRIAWERQFEVLSNRKKKEFNRVLNGGIPASLKTKIKSFKKEITGSLPTIATRKSSEMVLSLINEIFPETIGGSADLTGSNNTLTSNVKTFDTTNRSGRYLYYGIREHAMAGIMNGLSLHGGVIPYGGTFMAFADYARGSMRLSALMKIRVIYVMTHDSIGLGEDGPTHQPVEHLAMLRATPNINVFRPADTVETAEAWEIAVCSLKTPSVLALSRQNLPTVRTKHYNNNLTSRGGYILRESISKRRAIIIATGSEVEIAIEAYDLLESEGIGVRIVSLPCWELFESQEDKYVRKVLPPGSVRVGIEAGVKFGWEKWLSEKGGNSKKSAFVGMKEFGASGPAKDLYDNFNITSKHVVKIIKELI